MSDETKSGGLDLGLSGGAGLIVLVVVVLGGAWLLGSGGHAAGGYQPPRPEPWAGWKVIGLTVLVLVGLLAIGLVVYALAKLALSLRAAYHAHQVQAEIDQVIVKRTASQAETDRVRAELEAVRLVPWTEHGRLGALVRQTAQGWQVVNLDAEVGALLLGETGGVDRLLLDPLTMAQMQARHALEVERARASAYPSLTTYQQRLQLAGGDISSGNAGPAVVWPSKVWLRDLAPEPSTLTGLVLGVTVDDDGQTRPVTAGLADLVHVAVGGSSGWGKSVFLRSLALQLATAAETCDLALVDLEGATFAPFGNSERLLWPVADTEGAALAIMARLVDEMNRRRELYSGFPGVDSLAAYNARTDDPLPPVVCLIDEATALLGDKSVHNATRTLALRARKYGLWLVLGGQDWKAASIDTAIRNQLSTRVHFKAQSASQSRVLLGDGCAAAIETPGRAWAQLPGRPLTELQAPMVGLSDIEAALTGQSGPAEDLPEGEADLLLSALDAQLVLWAVEHNGGRFSVRAVAEAHPEVSRGQVQDLADRLTLDGWLIETGRERRITLDLEAEARATLG